MTHRGTTLFAFTLVELIATLAITVLIAGSTVVIVRNVMKARELVDRRAEAQQQAAGAMGHIATALRNAYRPLDAGDALFEGIDDEAGDLPNDRVRFRGVSRRVIRRGQPESDVREVEFSLAPPRGGRPAMLLGRTDPTRNQEPDGGGVVEALADNVIGLDLRYHDGQSWLESWPVSNRQWPAAVRVTLIYMADPQSRQVAQISRLINFPGWVVRPAGNAPNPSPESAGPRP